MSVEASIMKAGPKAEFGPLAGNGRGGRAAARGGANTNWSTTDQLFSITDLIETMKHVYLAPAYFRDTLFNRTETC
jgi:hypothetical protein